jgi:nucleotide-binding universal stress UspA family protein
MTVIVGVDGSVGALTALEFAAGEAIRRRSGLRVIAVVQLPAYGITSIAGFVPPPPAVLIEDVRSAVQQHVDDIVRAREGIIDDLPITVEALTGQPGEVLCEAAGNTDLLVVGRHSGAGSKTIGMLGSVGLHCVLHAVSPVTVVPRDL